ncbi:MAG: leucine-rich repeat protein, partial [Clostridia bacterium]
MVRAKNKSIIDDAIRNILLYDYVDMEIKERKQSEMANYGKAEDEDFYFYESSYYRPTMQIELLLFWKAMDLTTESYYFKDFKTISLYHPTLANAAEIKKISVSEQYPTISLNSFEFYDSLEEITLCEGVKTIGKCQYRDLDTLFDLVIPNAYYEYSKGLELKEDSLQIAGNLEEYPIVNLHGKERKNVNNSRIKKINLPQSLNKIGVSGLAGIGIASLEIPKNVTKIRRMAFIGCPNLEYVKIPEGITVLDVLLFSECESLKY